MSFWNDAYLEDPGAGRVEDRVILDEVAGLPPRRALDLGCGTGELALELAGRGWSVVGVDIAPEAVRLANRTAAERGVDASFVVGDVATWRPNESFDLVVSTYALPGGVATTALLNVAQAALSEGGTLIIVEWSRSMAKVWSVFQPEDLATPDEVAAHFSELTVDTAEVRRLKNTFRDPADVRYTPDGAAEILVVRARKRGVGLSEP